MPCCSPGGQGGLCEKLSFTKPFHLDTRSTETNWRDPPLKPSRDLSSYAEAEVYREFIRFSFRDASLGVVSGITFGIGFVLIPRTTILYPEGTTNFLLVAGILVLLASAALAVFFFVVEESAFAARMRKYLVTFIAFLLLAIPASWQSAYLLCYAKEDMATMFRDTPSREGRSLIKYCYNTFSAIVTAALVLAPLTLRLSPMRVAIFVSLHNIIYVWTYFWTDGMIPYSQREFLTVVYLLAIQGIMTLVMAAVRQGLLKQQFEQVLAMEQARLKAHDRERFVETLLTAMLPSSVLLRLVHSAEKSPETTVGQLIQDYTDAATVLFADMVCFTAWSSSREPQAVVTMLNTLCSRVDAEAATCGVEKIKTIGDAYWAVTGLPRADADHADRMIFFASMMLKIIENEGRRHPEWGGNVQFRVGICSGALSGTVFGTQRLSYEVFGATNKLAEECEKSGAPQRICVTESTVNACLSQLAVEPWKVIVVDETMAYGEGESVAEAPSKGSTGTTTSSGSSSVNCRLLRLYLVQPQPYHRPSLVSSTMLESIGEEGKLMRPTGSFLLGTGVGSRGSEEDTASLTIVEERGSLGRLPPASADQLGRWTDALSMDQQERGSVQSQPGSYGLEKSESFEKMTGNRTPTTSGVDPTWGERELQLKRAFAAKRAAAKKHHLVMKRREHRLQQKAARFVALSSPTFSNESISDPHVEEETLEDKRIGKRSDISRRKHNCCLMSFADPDIEKSYIYYIRQHYRLQLLITRIGMLVLDLALLLAIAIEGAVIDSALSIVLLTLGTAIHLGCVANLVFLWKQFKEYRHVDEQDYRFFINGSTFETSLLHVGAYCMILGFGFVPFSFVGNDVSFLYPLFEVLMIYGNFTTSWVLLFVFNILYVAVCCVSSHQAAYFDSDISFYALALLYFGCMCYLNEAFSREQFMDHLVAQELAEEQRQAKQQHESLLQDMLPDHVIPAFSHWIEHGQRFDASVAQHYREVVVAFVKLQPLASTEQLDLEMMGPLGSPVRKSRSNSPPPEGQSPSKRSSWLTDQHIEVDRVLAMFEGGIEKMKTIGNLVMLAGPFAKPVTSLRGLQQDISTMLCVLHQLCRRTQVEAVGVHVGEVVAAVLGTSRVCFDIFGDVVNVASRVMSQNHSRGGHKRVSVAVASEAQQNGGDNPLSVGTGTSHHSRRKSSATSSLLTACARPTSPIAVTRAVLLGLTKNRKKGKEENQNENNPREQCIDLLPAQLRVVDSFSRPPPPAEPALADCASVPKHVSVSAPYFPPAKGKGYLTVYQVVDFPSVNRSEHQTEGDEGDAYSGNESDSSSTTSCSGELSDFDRSDEKILEEGLDDSICPFVAPLPSHQETFPITATSASDSAVFSPLCSERELPHRIAEVSQALDAVTV